MRPVPAATRPFPALTGVPEMSKESSTLSAMRARAVQLAYHDQGREPLSILERIFYAPAEDRSLVVPEVSPIAAFDRARNWLAELPEDRLSDSNLARALHEGGLYGSTSKIRLLPLLDYIRQYDVPLPIPSPSEPSPQNT